MKTSTSSLALLLLFAACGGDGDGDGDGNGDGNGDGGSAAAGSCEELANRWCAQACSCTAGSECRIKRGIVSETHESETNCTTFYAALGCNTAPEDPQWATTCDSSLAAAQCDGTDGLLLPEACHY